jgi:hypothetical protein
MRIVKQTKKMQLVPAQAIVGPPELVRENASRAESIAFVI